MKRNEHYHREKHKNTRQMFNLAIILSSTALYRESGAASPFYGFGYFFGAPPTGQRR
jgi:hypothetical protein